MLINERIQAACAEKGKTVKWLIEQIGMTETGYYLSLRNESIKLSTIRKIAFVLDKPAVYFFSSTVEKVTVAEPAVKYGRDVLPDPDLTKAYKRIIELQDELSELRTGPKAAGEKAKSPSPHGGKRRAGR